MSFEEIKKLRKMSKYQINQLLREKRITKMDEFISKCDPDIKQYNFLSIYCKNQYTEVYSKILKAVKSINEGRNSIIEALTQLDSLNIMTEQLDIFDPVKMKEAATFFVDNKLGFDYNSFDMWKYRKREKAMNFVYDPLVVTSNGGTEVSDPKDFITCSTKIMYH